MTDERVQITLVRQLHQVGSGIPSDPTVTTVWSEQFEADTYNEHNDPLTVQAIPPSQSQDNGPDVFITAGLLSWEQVDVLKDLIARAERRWRPKEQEVKHRCLFNETGVCSNWAECNIRGVCQEAGTSLPWHAPGG